jgi:hypothetical protein
MEGVAVSGNRTGGKLAAATNKAKYGEGYYAVIGSAGGKASNTGGYAKAIPCVCVTIAGDHFVRNCAGRRGGLTSRRTKEVIDG